MSPSRVAESPPQTSQSSQSTPPGTYIEEDAYGLEALESYAEGGYHPVHLGDCLGFDGRYRVIHKLGFGSFSTVWLCRDTEKDRYVALKIATADAAAEYGFSLSIPRSECTAPPLGHFAIDGPNGLHQCIVFPFLGPRVSDVEALSPFMKLEKKEIGPMLRKLAFQTVNAMKFLHRNGIAHGDFRPANILLKLKNLDQLTEAELFSIIGEPERSVIRSRNEQGRLPEGSPMYLVPSANLQNIDAKYLTGEVCVVDFGEAYHLTEPPFATGIPETYLPPELLVPADETGEEPIDGFAAELWALGCTLFEIRMQAPLFYMLFGEDEILTEMVALFGKPHAQLWRRWADRGAYFTEDGVPLCPLPEPSLEDLLAEPLQMSEVEKNGNHKLCEMDVEERRLFIDLLYGIMQFVPEKRATLDDILEHEWFQL